VAACDVFGSTAGGIAGTSVQTARRVGGLTHDESFFLMLNGDTAEEISVLWDKLADGATVIASLVSAQSAAIRTIHRSEPRPAASAVPATVIPGYTDGVKTAISLPDDTFEQATRQAAELGISRSEFFARAARSYLDQLAAHSLTRQINEALQTTEDDSNAAAAAAGRRYLAGQGDW